MANATITVQVPEGHEELFYEAVAGIVRRQGPQQGQTVPVIAGKDAVSAQASLQIVCNNAYAQLKANNAANVARQAALEEAQTEVPAVTLPE